jgi:hypothetical protein
VRIFPGVTFYQNDLAVHLDHHRSKRSCFKRCGLMSDARNAGEPGLQLAEDLAMAPVAFSYFLVTD